MSKFLNKIGLPLALIGSVTLLTETVFEDFWHKNDNK